MPNENLTEKTLADVQAGIPARDAEIEALRKENAELREQLDAIGAGGVKGRLMPGANADRETLMLSIVQAGQRAGIIRADLESASVSECLHILGCLGQPAAPVSAEPVAWMLTGAHGHTRCVWVEAPSAEMLEMAKIDGDTVTPLYSRPVSDQAQPENFDNDTKMVAGCCGRSECGGECGNDWVGMVPAPQPVSGADVAPQNVADALDLMDAILAPERGLLAVPYTSATVTAAREDLALIRAALAQQDAMLDSRIAADMAAIVETLDEGEWVERIAKTDLGQRLERHITQLVGNQQDADTVDAERMRKAIKGWFDLQEKISKSGRPPHTDFWDRSIFDAENELRKSANDAARKE